MAHPICDRAYADILAWRGNRRSGKGYFLPRSRIPYSVGLIDQIVTCPCPRCRIHQNLLTPQYEDYPQERIDATEYSKKIQMEYLSLFALLIWIKKPIFILAFIQKRLNDETILIRLGEKKCEWHKFEAFEVVRRNLEEGYFRTSASILSELTEQIEDSWSNFLRPRISDSTHENFNRRLTLPFYDEKSIGQGAGGTVYAFKIYDKYNEIPTAQHVREFARKEMQLLAFGEQKLLSRVNNLEHPHIARLLFSYQQQDAAGTTKFNVVFRLANTNLNSYLRDPKYGAQNLNFSDISKVSIWTQIAGVIHALDAIHTMPGEFALHLDLKPANILVEIDPATNEPTFLITDFGLARLRNPLNHGSGVREGGGDEAYAPPETDGDRKHDIWSMGCIVLEALSFVLGGFLGVQRLDKARGTDNPYQAFWEKTSSGQLRIRQTVDKHMDWLADVAKTQELSPRQLRFAERMLSLIALMFSIGKAERPRAGKIYELFRQTLVDEDWRFSSGSTSAVGSGPGPGSGSGSDSFVTVSRQSSIVEHREKAAPDLLMPRRDTLPDAQFADFDEGWVEIGDGTTKMLRALLARWNRYPSYEPEPIRLQILERFLSKGSELRLVVVLAHERGSRELTAERQKLKLIPAYALRKDHNYTRTLAGLRFVVHDDEKSFFDIDFDGDLYDLRIVQGVLMGQNILWSVDVERVVILPPKPTRFKKLLSSQTPGSSPLLDQRTVTTVQIWKEAGMSQVDCKIVVYATPPGDGPSQIFVIGFSDSFGFHSQVLEGKRNATLSSYLNNNPQPTYLSILKPPNGRKEPSFHLDHEQFEIQCREDSNWTRFASIDMQFQNENDRIAFLNMYKGLKKQWLSDMKSMLR